jgi:hypothetical protein
VKTCTGPCGALLPLEAYHRDRSRPDGRTSRCAGCRNAAARKPGGLGPITRVPLGATAKRCTGPCGRLLPLGRFDRAPHGQGGRTARCRDCLAAAWRRRYAARRQAGTAAA